MPSFWQRGEDYAKEVSSELIEQIKEGVAPWQKPWKPGEQCTPENFSTGKSYTGGNSLYLMSRGIRQGHGDNRWGTYRQITAAGGQVRKGQKGTQVLFFTDRTRKTEQGKPVKDKDGKQVYQGERRSCPVVRQYTVFNVEQADGAERVIRASGTTVQHVAGNRAYYRLAEDKVVLPEQGQFATANGYYQTALHELGHASGHESRLNRKTLQDGIAAGFGSEAYAREELRAEISAMMTGAAQPTSRTGSRCSRRSRERFTTRPAKRRKSPTTSPNRCAIELPKRRRSMVSWRRSTPTQPGRRSATHPAPRRKRKHRNWNGTPAPAASPVRSTDV